MLDYRLLSSKREIKLPTENGKTVACRDLLFKTFNDDVNLDGLYDYFEINEYYIARPDLVSLACYGNDKYADIICKLNGISNPFELNKDTILLIPSVSMVDKLYDRLSTVGDDIVNDDDQIQKARDNYKKLISETRSPNEATINDHNYYEDKSHNIIFY